MAIICDLRSAWSLEIVRAMSSRYKVTVFNFEVDKTYSIKICDEVINDVEVVNLSASRISKFFYLPFFLFYFTKKNPFDFSLVLYCGFYNYLNLFIKSSSKAGYWVGSDINRGGFIRDFINSLFIKCYDVNFYNGCSLLKKGISLSKYSNHKLQFIGLNLDSILKYSTIEKTKSVVCARPFERVYNNIFILKCLSRLDLTNLGYTFIFPCSGTYLKSCQEFVNEHFEDNNKRYIKFFGGVQRAHFLKIIAQSEFYISASVSDGASVTLWEAMLLNSFPILSNIEANQFWDEYTYVTLFNFDIDDFNQKLISTLCSNKPINELRSNRDYVFSNLDISNLANIV